MTKREALIEKRIQRGVDLLDAEFPRWFQKIKISEFDFSNPCHCVIGQSFTNFDMGLAALRVDGIRYGFDAAIDSDFEYMHNRWLEIIRERQKQNRKASHEKSRR